MQFRYEVYILKHVIITIKVREKKCMIIQKKCFQEKAFKSYLFSRFFLKPENHYLCQNFKRTFKQHFAIINCLLLALKFLKTVHKKN